MNRISVTREDIIAEARTWLGTPFHHQGRVRGHGVDCAGLVACVGKALGLTCFDTARYGRSPDPAMMGDILRRELVAKPISEIQLADVLWLSFDSEPQHVAIVTDVGIIHATSAIRRVVEHGLDDVWRSRIRCAFGWPGVA